MDIHPKFATWLASANITANDETLRKWWTGLTAFNASAADIISLVQLAKGPDEATVSASGFYAALQKEDAALLPNQKFAIAAIASAKLHMLVESGAALGEFTALLCAVCFPGFEAQPAYRKDLSALVENYLARSSRVRANLTVLVDRLDGAIKEKMKDSELEQILAVTAEETNMLWWIFGGRSRDNNEAFTEIASETIPFVAAKELADLTTLLPGPVAIAAFADKVCQSGRSKPLESLVVNSAINKLPPSFVTEISARWTGHRCLALCRLTQAIVMHTSTWGKTQKLATMDLCLLFYRECLVLRAWKKVAL